MRVYLFCYVRRSPQGGTPESESRVHAVAVSLLMQCLSFALGVHALGTPGRKLV